MHRHIMKIMFCLFLFLSPFSATAQTISADKNAAVIFAYHRIGEDQYPETNIRREQFEAHIKELVSGAYNVLPLPEVIAALRNGDTLPPRTVALTFDGGHKSILDNAVPLLKKNDLPFTLFISTDHIDRQSAQYMSWSGLKSLQRHKLATIGLHPASYIRLYNKDDGEMARQLNKARTKFREKLEKEPDLFAYPFGEYSKAYRDLVKKQGFDAALGQQSGAAYGGSDIYALPRFTMTESHGGLDRFRLTVNALPLPVTEIQPKDPLLQTKKPSIGFTVDKELTAQIKNISCFVSGQAKPELEIIGESRVELRLEKPFETERIRVNCTMPLPVDDNYEDPSWRWFGMLLIAPDKPGN